MISFLGFLAFVTVLLWLNAVVLPYVKVYFTCPFNATSEAGIQQKFRQNQNQPKFLEKIMIVNELKVEVNEWEIIDTGTKIKPKTDPQCANIRNEDRFDCYPEGDISRSACESRGCCWSPVVPKKTSTFSRILPPLNVPWCFYPKDYPGYKVDNSYTTAIGFNANFSRSTQSNYPETIMDLTMEVRYETSSRVRIKVSNV